MVNFSILAGGQSRRMGENKALKQFCGATLIETVVGRVKTVSQDIAIISGQPELFMFTGLPVYADLVPGAGVLGGIYTALKTSGGVYTAAPGCDMPFISPALYRVELELLESSGADIVIPRSVSGLEPLHAMFRTDTCLTAVEEAINAGEMRIVSWFTRVNVRVMTPDEIHQADPSPNIFNNLNDQKEFEAAEQVFLSGG